MLWGVKTHNYAHGERWHHLVLWQYTVIWQLQSNTNCQCWSGHTRTKYNALALSYVSKKVGTRCPTSPSHERFLEGSNQPLVRLAEKRTVLHDWCYRSPPKRRK